MVHRSAVLSLVLTLVACGGSDPKADPDTTAPPIDPPSTAETTCTPRTWYLDADGDGHGADPVEACEAPVGAVATGDDCDDEDALRHPGAEERCDGLDDDCDGELDEDLWQYSWYVDADGDGLGVGDAIVTCEVLSGHASQDGDCDDALAEVGGPVQRFVDDDGDGYGTSDVALFCPGDDGFAEIDGDCDDAAELVHPGATEICDGIDNDCDGTTEAYTEELPWFVDDDGDGVGTGDALWSCDVPSGYVADEGDCDDSNAEVYPGALDWCNGIDDDCDGPYDLTCLTPADAFAEVQGASGWDGHDLVALDADGDGQHALAVGTYFTDRVYVIDDLATAPVQELWGAAAFLTSGANFTCFGCSISVVDLDGDGLEELAVGSALAAATAGSGQVYVFSDPMNASGPADATTTIEAQTDYEYLGDYFAVRSGDLDGDGQVDLVVGSSPILGGRSFVRIVDAADPSRILATIDDDAAHELGYTALVGDVNADGIDDLIVGDLIGGAYAFYGPVTGSLTPSDADLSFEGDVSLGAQLALGDTNGDGWLDLAIGGDEAGDGGAVHVLEGPLASSVDIATDASWSILGDAGGSVGHQDDEILLHDVNGDGLDDLIVGQSYHEDGGSVGIFLGGGRTGESRFVASDVHLTGYADMAMGTGLAVGEFDGQPGVDLAVGAPGGTGGAFVFENPVLTDALP